MERISHVVPIDYERYFDEDQQQVLGRDTITGEAIDDPVEVERITAGASPHGEVSGMEPYTHRIYTAHPDPENPDAEPERRYYLAVIGIHTSRPGLSMPDEP